MLTPRIKVIIMISKATKSGVFSYVDTVREIPIPFQVKRSMSQTEL